MSSKRLKHFCQLCRKQCKDENGFKCHLNSQSHQMRVMEYASNPLQHVEKASKEFEWRFLQMLKTKYPGEPKYLEELYNQLIEEKKFLKFNHTQWKNLAQFGTHLQGIKNIQVIGTPPNCKVVYIVNKTKDFIESAKKEKILADRQREKQQFQKSINSRIEREKEFAEKQQALLNAKLAELDKQRSTMQIPDKLELNIEGFNTKGKRSALFTVEELERQANNQEVVRKAKVDNIEKLYQKLKNQDQQSDEEEEIEWIRPGITIRIKPHDIDPVFHNKKCKIIKIVEPFVAQIHLGTALIEIDQSNIETVIPKVGHQVMVLYGEHVGQIGCLKEAHVEQGFGVIQVKEQILKVPFSLFSRFDSE